MAKDPCAPTWGFVYALTANTGILGCFLPLLARFSAKLSYLLAKNNARHPSWEGVLSNFRQPHAKPQISYKRHHVSAQTAQQTCRSLWCVAILRRILGGGRLNNVEIRHIWGTLVAILGWLGTSGQGCATPLHTEVAWPRYDLLLKRKCL